MTLKKPTSAGLISVSCFLTVLGVFILEYTSDFAAEKAELNRMTQEASEAFEIVSAGLRKLEGSREPTREALESIKEKLNHAKQLQEEMEEYNEVLQSKEREQFRFRQARLVAGWSCFAIAGLVAVAGVIGFVQEHTRRRASIVTSCPHSSSSARPLHPHNTASQ